MGSQRAELLRMAIHSDIPEDREEAGWIARSRSGD